MSVRVRSKDLPLGGEPRVQLLPPSIAQREKVRQAQSLTVLSIVLAIIVAGGAIAGAFFVSVNSAATLVQAQAETASIQAQQLQYVAGAIAAADVQDGTDAITVVGATDVDWRSIFDQVRAALPEGAAISAFVVTARGPWEAKITSEAPLRGEREATVQLTISSPSVLEMVSFYQTLSAHVDAFADAVLTKSQYDVSRAAWSSEIELTLDSTILSQRYAADKVEKLLGDDRVTAAVAARDALDELRARITAGEQAVPPQVDTDTDAKNADTDADAAGAGEAKR